MSSTRASSASDDGVRLFVYITGTPDDGADFDLFIFRVSRGER